jgi:ubiquitin C-terminal hydrolase
LPNILIITINRAVLGKPFNNSILEINERIDLKDFLDENKKEEEYTTYTLYGINECAKYLENFGHYYSFVKIESKWFEFDDRKVSRLEPNLKSQNVVGLYYIRDKFDSFNNNNV